MNEYINAQIHRYSADCTAYENNLLIYKKMEG